jgi:hypothetical protein
MVALLPPSPNPTYAAPGACRRASALVHAKHRGHVACPQASLSTRSTAPRPERDECATRLPSRQEQGTGRHAPTRPRHYYYRDLPYCPRRADQRLCERVSSCRALSAALLAPMRVSSCDPQCPSECSRGSRGASRDPSRDGAHEIVNEWLWRLSNEAKL